MRVRIVQGYTDSQLGRIVHRDEEFSVSEARAKRLIETGVAEAVSEDVSDYTDKIAALKVAVSERDTRIAELETEIAALKVAIDGEASDYGSMEDSELATIAAEKGINIEGMTRRKVINALERAV